ncbi:DUF6058 family natural product biosynthesis protein [Flavobacterium fluviale]|uniref:Uncharacterized protein n=1 Tax=Flavobacterium fluviale TaxID=2249356 RepID=A0A344LQJ1_9FLAO|nr:DUF6058 family natural product biosynthesis protein [Flavobacterium fluviale]AXB56183.1 hypothetical protein HYN86_06040 [Flavobacterium fluviale]
MDLNLKYITANYVEFEEVIREAKISSDKLSELIENKLVPEASYSIKSDITISSSLNDSYNVTIERKYFHPSVLQFIKENAEISNPEKFKTLFKENLLTNLKNHAQKKYAYGNVFDENGVINAEKIDQALEEEWDYFCKGVYGICTLNNNEKNIIEKEIAIKRILGFIENKSSYTTEEQENRLKKLNDEFNKATSNFAPYQRELSSRGKYLDKLLEEFSLEDMIKKDY